ncbi:MAG TPA: hypothetical protein VKG78_00510 [Opitutaceae bacterium]|nr:hypothetical protein [Opitutaceae bacterium]
MNATDRFRGPSLWAAAALALSQAVALDAWYWPGSLPDTDTSGAWTALADDLAHGTFYRPLQGPLGYGGTRYGPLFFTLHAGLIRMGLGPRSSGTVAVLLSAAAFGAALFFLMRSLGVRRSIALPATLLAYGTVTAQMMTLAVRGDYLAAALNLAGVSLAVPWIREARIRSLLMASAAFAAADLAKLTSAFGLLAVVAWGWLHFGRGRPLALAGLALALIVAGYAGANAASDGRMLADFLAVGAGGARIGPGLIPHAAVRFTLALGADPILCLLLIQAAFSLVILADERPIGLPCLYSCATLLATIAIFGSPGTYLNHTIDLCGAAAAVTAVGLERHGDRRVVRWGVALYGLVLAATWLPGVPSIRQYFAGAHRPDLASVRLFLGRAGAGAHPMLATNPLLPIIAGERPVVADAFNLELLLSRDPGLARGFYRRVADGEFGSVVLSNWPNLFPRDVDSPDDPIIGECWPAVERSGALGAGLYPTLRDRYRIVMVRRPYIYLVKRENAGAFRMQGPGASPFFAGAR